MWKPEPGKKDVPGAFEKSGIGFLGLGAMGGQAAIFFSFIFAACVIAAPEIQFKKFPAAALPTTAFAAAAIAGGFRFERSAPAGTAR